METITNFEQLVAHLSQLGTRKRVAVVCASDDSTQYAVARALDEKFIDAIFVGSEEEVQANPAFAPHADHVSFVAADDCDDAARKAVALVREGKADVLMKGLINTDNLLHAVLNKETGILPKGRVLTHITASILPNYPKFLFFTDAAVIPYPTHEQRVEQVRYVARLCQSFGIESPKISLIHCSEKVGGKFFPFTERYAEIIESANNGEFGPCVIDGPLDLKTSSCKESLDKKGTLLAQKLPGCWQAPWPLWCCPRAATVRYVSSAALPWLPSTHKSFKDSRFSTIIFSIGSDRFT